MKTTRFFLVLTVFTLLQSCNTKQEKLQNTIISVDKAIHDFGEIPLKKEVNTIFNLKNKGEHSLLISDVKTSCGCTVPEWTKEKIQLGEKGVIKVSYDANHPDRFHKTITVFYNGEDSPLKLTIKGEVAYPEE